MMNVMKIIKAHPLKKEKQNFKKVFQGLFDGEIADKMKNRDKLFKRFLNIVNYILTKIVIMPQDVNCSK